MLGGGVTAELLVRSGLSAWASGKNGQQKMLEGIF
jgi:hypothetical protein